MQHTALIEALGAVVGPRQLLTGRRATERYRRGFRSGEGDAAAVVRPGTLLELWRVLEAAVAHDAIVIMQAANTGLTEGSSPSGAYDRPVVIVNTLRIDGIQLIDGGRQVVSLAGATLYRLEDLLRPLGRVPHSVIGSSCIGASIVGGVCNNSGGALVERGPAYTELSLYAQIDAEGRLQLVNHLGIALGTTPEEILTRLEARRYGEADIGHQSGAASDRDYESRVRQVDEPSAARYNADPRRLHEAAGCAGKLAVFAVRLDTFPAPTAETVFYLGSNQPEALTELRRALLAMPQLPIAGEYMHRDMFDVARRYGKDTFLVIQYFGTQVMPALFAIKGRTDAMLDRLPGLPRSFADRVLQWLTTLWPEHLPQRLLDFRDRYEHHLMLRVASTNADPIEAVLRETLGDRGAYFRATTDEGKKAFLHRFAAAGAAIRASIMAGRRSGGLLALDIALRRNDHDWVEHLPPALEAQLSQKLYYGHFLCHVFHQDYLLVPGADPEAVKAAMLELLEARGAEYPAEHNVGHVYHAAPEHLAHFRALDPTNSLNPGIGHDSKARHYGHIH